MSVGYSKDMARPTPELIPTPSQVEFDGMTFTPLVSGPDMERAEARWAEEIYEGFNGYNALLVAIENGGVTPRDLLANRLEAMGMVFETAEIGVSSYGEGTSSGDVTISKPLDVEIAGRHVIMVDDIYDTGKTIEFLNSTLYKTVPDRNKPARLVFATMLAKRKPQGSPQRKPLPEFIAQRIDDHYVIGRGLNVGNHEESRRYEGIMAAVGHTALDGQE